VSPSPDAPGEQDEPLIERQLAWSFGLTEFDWYTAERSTLGVPALFRVLSPQESELCREAAWAFDSPAAQLTETQVQHLARAVVSVDGQDLPPSLPWRLHHFRSMPEVAMQRVYQQFEVVTQEYWAATAPDTVKN
jgi:hypothetical protein